MTEVVTEVLTALVVDDDEVDRMAVRRLLRAAGLEVRLEEAPEAEDALERLAAESFDVIILDLRLPRMSGLEVLRRARAQGLRTPVIMLTGHGDEQTAVELMKAGAVDYIPKPALEAERLRQSVQNAVRLGRLEAQARAAQEALRQSEERFRAVALQSAHIVWVWDPSGQHFEAPGWEAFTGQPESQMQGEGWLQMLHPDDVARVVGAWQAALEREQFVDVEFRILPRAGRPLRHVVSRGRPLRGPDGRVREWVGSLTDITEQRLREQEVQRRVEFEQQLVGIVSHDLRNPLSAITVSAGILANGQNLDERQRRAVARVQASTERANRMIETLLDFTRARLGGGIPVLVRPADVHEAARRAVDEAQAAHPARTLQLRCEGDAQLTCDPERLEQVLANLIGNALRYGAEDGAVEVVCCGEAEQVTLTVYNRGNPIPSELLPRLFEPYYVGSREGSASKGGLGLGLYIVKEIVRAHGGDLHVRSSAEQGTTFTVRLPRAVAVAA